MGRPPWLATHGLMGRRRVSDGPITFVRSSITGSGVERSVPWVGDQKMPARSHASVHQTEMEMRPSQGSGEDVIGEEGES